MFNLISNLFKTKKAQLFELEFKVFIISFLIAMVVTIVGFVVLMKMGYLDFAKPLLCGCSPK